jgi:hypothetical protein
MCGATRPCAHEVGVELISIDWFKVQSHLISEPRYLGRITDKGTYLSEYMVSHIFSSLSSVSCIEDGSFVLGSGFEKSGRGSFLSCGISLKSSLPGMMAGFST